MGQANRKKKIFKETEEMVGLVQTLKDIADNKFYTFLNDRSKFRRFGETFVEFFRMINLTEVKHPLITNDVEEFAIVVVTAEGSFLGKYNGAVLAKAKEIKKKYPKSKFIAVGAKAVGPLSEETPNIKSFIGIEKIGLYTASIDLKDYLIEQMIAGEIGKVIVVYSWLKNSDTQKVRSVRLLPCDDLLAKQVQFVDEFEYIIYESSARSMIGRLADLWIATRIYEIFFDALMAAAQAQSAFLDDSLDRQEKEAKKSKVIFRKAKKSDIDTSLRETFSARMISQEN